MTPPDDPTIYLVDDDVSAPGTRANWRCAGRSKI